MKILRFFEKDNVVFLFYLDTSAELTEGNAFAWLGTKIDKPLTRFIDFGGC